MKSRGEMGIIPTAAELGQERITEFTKIIDLCHDEIGFDARRIVYYYTLPVSITCHIYLNRLGKTHLSNCVSGLQVGAMDD